MHISNGFRCAILMVTLCMKSALIESMPLCSNRKCIRKILDLFRLRPIGLSLVIFGLSMNRIPVPIHSLNLLAIQTKIRIKHHIWNDLLLGNIGVRLKPINLILIACSCAQTKNEHETVFVSSGYKGPFKNNVPQSFNFLSFVLSWHMNWRKLNECKRCSSSECRGY